MRSAGQRSTWLAPLAHVLERDAFWSSAGTYASVHQPPPPLEPACAAEEAQPARARECASPGRTAAAATHTGSSVRVEVALLTVVWVGLLGLLIARGRKGAPSILGIRQCSPSYWGVTVLGFCWLLAISILADRRLVRPAAVAASAASSRRPVAGDVDWDGERAARCLLMSLVAGVVAGLVGVGGGIVLGPMMLELGVLPQVSSATTGTMVLLTSSSAAAVFLLCGLIRTDYALALGVVALSGGFLGKVGVVIIVRRYRAAALTILLHGPGHAHRALDARNHVACV